jgi:dGTPase
VFCDNENAIMRGELKESLLDISKFKTRLKEIRDKCKEKIYINSAKLQIEAAGYNVIMGLMDLYGGMILQFLEMSGVVEDMDQRNQGLYNLFPEEFKSRLRSNQTYASMLVLVDYISGMTDRYALDLHQKLCGSSAVLGRMT